MLLGPTAHTLAAMLEMLLGPTYSRFTSVAMLEMLPLPDSDMKGGVERYRHQPEHQEHVELLHMEP